MEARTELTDEPKKDLLKRVLSAGGETATLLTVSYLEGLALGATGRLTGAELIPAVPPAIDLFFGVAPTPERLVAYAAYGAGIATAYADKVYSVVARLADKI